MASGGSGTEVTIVSATRALKDKDMCFVGTGVPSAARDLARLTHAPDITLMSGALAPDHETRELAVASLHPGVDPEAVRSRCDWSLEDVAKVAEALPPSEPEMSVLRGLRERTGIAHGAGESKNKAMVVV